MQVFWQNKFAVLHFLYNIMYISKLLFTEMWVVKENRV